MFKLIKPEFSNLIINKENDYPSDDFRILDSWAVYENENQTDFSLRPLKYLCYKVEVMNPETGQKKILYKALKFLRIIRLPKDAKQSTAFMSMHEQVLSAVYENEYNFITIIANMLDPVPLGLCFLYGVQGVADNIDDAIEIADNDFAGLVGTLQGTYKVLHTRIINCQESEWLRQKLFDMNYLTMVRGLPKANKTGENAGNKGFGNRNVNPNSQSTTEEFIAGMTSYEYIIQVLAMPIDTKTLEKKQDKNQIDMTYWNGLKQGSKNFTASVSLPMVFSANAGNSSGWNHSYSNAEGLTYGTSESLSSGVSQSFGESLSHSFGQSESVSQGSSMSESMGSSTSENFGMSNSSSIGESQSEGISSSNSISEGSSSSVSEGTSSSHGTSSSVSDSYGESSSVSAGQSSGSSHSVGTSQNDSVSSSQSNSASSSSSSSSNVGHSSGHNSGQSYGSSSGTSVGASDSENKGGSVGILGTNGSKGYGYSTSSGSSSGKSFGQSEGFSNGWSSGTSNSTSQSLSSGNSISSSSSSGTSESFGTSTSNSFSESQGFSESHSSSSGTSNSMGTSHGISEGISSSHSIGSGTSSSNGISSGKSMGTSSGIGNGMSSGMSVGSTSGISKGMTSGISSGQSTSRGTSSGLSKGMSQGSSLTNGMGMGSSGSFTTGTGGSMGLGPSIGYSKQYQWSDQQVMDLLELMTFQNERLKAALRGQGAYHTYVSIACSTKKGLSSAKALAKSTWQNESAMIQPLQIINLTSNEQKHLLYHMSAFSSDVTKQDVEGTREYKYSTMLLPSELVAYTHLPRISEGGVYSEAEDIPTSFAVPSMKKGEIYMGNSFISATL